MSVTFATKDLGVGQFIIRQQGHGFVIVYGLSGEILGMTDDCETAVTITSALEDMIEAYNGLTCFAARAEAKAIFLVNGGSLV